jgi:hypothetical protein
LIDRQFTRRGTLLATDSHALLDGWHFFQEVSMRKLALCIPLAAVAALAGCAAPEEPRAVAPAGAVTSSSGAPVVSSGAPPVARTVVVVPAAVLRAGTGVVDSISAVPQVGAASAGASAPGAASRLAIRMSDGTMQYVDYGDRDITVGQRVELTSDGFIRKL